MHGTSKTGLSEYAGFVPLKSAGSWMHFFGTAKFESFVSSIFGGKVSKFAAQMVLALIALGK